MTFEKRIRNADALRAMCESVADDDPTLASILATAAGAVRIGQEATDSLADTVGIWRLMVGLPMAEAAEKQLLAEAN